MHTIAVVLFFTGGVIWAVGWLAALWAAFREHPLWGLLGLLLPPALLLFLVVHWQDAKGAFYLILFGFSLAFAATCLDHL